MNLNKFPRFCYRRLLSNRSSNFFRFNTYSQSSNCAILGIETSCDDTGCAIINQDGKVLSDVVHSQNLIHLRNGGIIPDIAQDLHRANIEPAISGILQEANMTMADISAIAVTLEPGLPLSLVVGMKYAKHLARRHNKPIIPIHHMEAHALITRKDQEIPFPFLVLLISGGHCLLAVAQDVDKFLLLGESIDCAPGEIFDKVARRMKLKNIPEYSKMCGGQAIEMAALKATNPQMFKFPLPLADYKDCNFSFNGLKTSVLLQVHRKERDHEIKANNVIPELNDLCAAMLAATSRHLVHRLQRAIEFCHDNNLIPETNKKLVVSGGVACNNYIFNALTMLCSEANYKIYRPEAKLCTDNGVMIAWNGLEKWQRGIDIVNDFKTLDIKANSKLGVSLIDKVKESKIQTKLMKLNL
ncbi:tRNA N6-adenosine threonylcarbamoyltransferase, mitochondrial [Plutella xylostella]|uniref:tRNA N6-adenosine threonylcarbamoyltransferase, mitochondrial n=1 Tax=Plutella xylostella TaxID=51655 RepID=UPI0020329D5D|nr:tRNA N6-adenosine threonylcarbamoyltransferase, mitochondrial [Plutella xylostella]